MIGFRSKKGHFEQNSSLIGARGRILLLGEIAEKSPEKKYQISFSFIREEREFLSVLYFSTLQLVGFVVFKIKLQMKSRLLFWHFGLRDRVGGVLLLPNVNK
ncbi:hypothetical protein CDAR_105641 [Caerostris darwini]|uniref:Uncharacterized protein n=1 Tax=Caerostris darwini TaxID=1538125 RepID=A0AAV4V0D4_9ARAC|nr:hypothetical protein CDAR_105641 [Caerostris darwini]